MYSCLQLLQQAQILTPIPSTGFMYNPHMGRLKNLTCFEVFCLISIGAFSSNTALRNCFGTLFSEIPLRQELLFRNSANEGVNILAWKEPCPWNLFGPPINFSTEKRHNENNLHKPLGWSFRKAEGQGIVWSRSENIVPKLHLLGKYE